jgi:hypothetical protein
VHCRAFPRFPVLSRAFLCFPEQIGSQKVTATAGAQTSRVVGHSVREQALKVSQLGFEHGTVDTG